MPSQFQQEFIAASLFKFWSDQFPLVVTTAYPGTRIDTAALTEWLEITIDGWSRRPQRSGAPERIGLSLSVHCFVKQSLDKSRIYELSDAVRSTISQQTISLRDYDTSGTPVIGYATLLEPETRDLTRLDTDSLRHAMQHFVITCAGIAQQI